MARVVRKSGSEHTFSHCPICGYWVPAKYMNYDFDEELGLIRICDNCLEGEYIFETKSLQYDPYRGKVQCIYCDSYNTEQIQVGRKRGEPDAWRCRDCEEVSYVLS